MLRGRRLVGALGGVALALAIEAWRRRRRRSALPSSTSHLQVGRVWEYDILPLGGVETTSVLDSSALADGREVLRMEFRRSDRSIQGTFSRGEQGWLLQLGQGEVTFDPPLVALGDLRVGAHWKTRSWMVFPSMFRASSPTEVSGRVVAVETVTVPAGTFETFRIEVMVCGRASTAWHAAGIGMVRELAEDQELLLRRILPRV